MKRIHMLFAALMLLVLAGCIRDSLEVPCAIGGKDNILLVVGKDDGMLTRAANADTESKVTHLDVLIFDKEGNKVHHELFQNLSDDNTLLLSKRKSAFEIDEEYTVFLIANYPVDNENSLSAIEKQTELQDLKLRTANVHATGLDDTNANVPGSFLMDGHTSMVLNPEGTSQDAIEVPVSLKRAAAKIVITLKQGEKVKFIHDETSPEPLKNRTSRKPVNFPMSTFVVEPSEGEMKAFRPVLYSGASTTIFGTDVSGMGTSNATMTMTLYAYPNDWREDALADNEPSVLMRVPLVENEETVDENYYKIPVNLSSKKDEKGQLKRNHIYNITVTINGRGGENEAVPVELTDVLLEVEPWRSKDIVVGGEDSPEFLFLSDKKVRMDNARENHSVSYSSSSPIEKVEVVEVYYYDKFGLKQTLEDSQILGLPITVSASTESGEGVIDISSPVPTNLAVRYIVVKVTNEEGKAEELTFEQYPLEYVTSQLGYFSYRTDFTANNREDNVTTWVSHYGFDLDFVVPRETNDRVNVQLNNGTDENKWKWNFDRWNMSSYSESDWVSGENTVFISKVLQDYSVETGLGKIFSYGWSLSLSSRWGCYYLNSGRENSNVYHIRIAATSDENHIGIPRRIPYTGSNVTFDEDMTDPADDNAKVVSPSFMVSSHLSILKGEADILKNEYQAASHCDKYVEVVFRNRPVTWSNTLAQISNPGTYASVKKQLEDDGFIVYDDWRLPTRAELEIIDGFQANIDAHELGGSLSNSGTYAMDWLLDRKQYWSANGAVTITNNPANSRSGIGIRCVRDHFKDK